MPPVCECHGLPQYWSKDSRYTLGGFWRCAEKQRVDHRRRYHENPEPVRQQQMKYWHNQSNDVWRERNQRRRMNAIRQRLREAEQELADL